MVTFIERVFTYIHTYDLDSPFSFFIIILTILILFRKWGILLLILMTLFLSFYTRDIIIINLITKQELITLPFIIYGVGSILIGAVSLISFIKYMLE